MKTLRDRWRSDAGAEVARVAIEALATGGSLAALGLSTIGGRIDLRGIMVESTSKSIPTTSVAASALGDLVELRSVALRSVDLSYASLRNLRLYDVTMDDVVLEGADCRGLRAWGLDVQRSSLHRCNLAGAVLGAFGDGYRSSYSEVDFSEADMRRIVSTAAAYTDCDFSNARLDGIDFQSSKFVRCRFAGELRDVIFWDHGFRTGKAEPNRMEDVDFSDATLCFVDFRRLDLDRVILPRSPGHLIVHSYPSTLECALAKLSEVEIAGGRRARALVEHCLKWCGPNQDAGVFYLPELAVEGIDVAAFSEIVQNCERACMGAS